MKYKETVTATVDSITAGETKTLFTASDYCIVKVVPTTAANNCNFQINNTNAGSLGANGIMETKQGRELSNRQEFLSGSVYYADTYYAYYGNALLLLKKGDELQIYCSYGTLTDLQNKVYLYKIE